MNKYTDTYYSLIKEYKEMHEKGINNLRPESTFQGSSLFKHIFSLREIIIKKSISSLIDFGCGKAIFYKNKLPYKIKGKTGEFTIQEFWNVKDIVLYDPGVKEFELYPKQKKDLVICTDVLEHIPMIDTENFLNDIYLLANKAVFFAVSVRESKKKLKSGQSVHINIRKEDEWDKIFNSFQKRYPDITTYYNLEN